MKVSTGEDGSAAVGGVLIVTSTVNAQVSAPHSVLAITVSA